MKCIHQILSLWEATIYARLSDYIGRGKGENDTLIGLPFLISEIFFLMGAGSLFPYSYFFPF
jgi:hypothetical protein